MASRDWSGRPPGGTESNISEQLFNVLNDESHPNQSMARATGQSKNQLMARATDYLKAMQMNDISELLYHNESHVIDQMIDQATEILSEKAKPFNRTETVGDQEIFVVSQEEIDVMVSNIPTPKSKHNKNLIPMVLLLMHTINGVITNTPLVALCDSGSSHSLMNKGSLPRGVTTFQTDPIKTTTTAGDHLCHEAVVMTDLSLL